MAANIPLQLTEAKAIARSQFHRQAARQLLSCRETCWRRRGQQLLPGRLLHRAQGRGSVSVSEDLEQEVSVPDIAPEHSGLRHTDGLSHGRHTNGASTSRSAGSASLHPEMVEAEEAEAPSSSGLPGGLKTAAPLVLVAGLAAMLGAGFLYKEQIKGLLNHFIGVVDDLGPLGYVAYAAVYTLLEIVAVPAVPLTMTAGVIFGVLPGVAVVSASNTAAAAIAFLIARYAARDKVLELAKGNPQFAAVDRAIARDSFKVVLLLRLSPLLPLALSNYIYGLTSVDFLPYVLASWLGMLPGTVAYVTAGSYGRALLEGGEAGGGVQPWQVALGLAFTGLAIAYIGRLAKGALAEAEEETEQQ